MPESRSTVAADLLAAARGRGLTVACAESLTGGALCATLVEAAGASDVVRGGVVAYQLDVKASALGVDDRLLDDPGPVSEEVAQAMAAGVRARLGADIGIATTGAAGPEPHGGREPGTVCIAVAFEGSFQARTLLIDGDRGAVRAGAVEAALALTLAAIGGGSWPEGTQLG